MSGTKKPTTKRTCPGCGKAAAGNFCHNCGSALGGRFCNKCGAQVSGKASFCNKCGAPVKGAGGPQVTHKQAAVATVGGSNAAWWAGGAAMFGAILVVGWLMTQPQGPAAPQGGAAPAAGGAAAGQSTLDLSSMSPREAADRLFNRVMTSMSQADTAGAMSFQPMAVQAYQAIPSLDLDGIFHQGLLELIADPGAALVTADRILAADTDHLFGLSLSAQAALGAQDIDRAVAMYGRLLEVYGAQVARSLPEYEAHQNLVEQMPTDAEAFLAAH